jgi:hypothetical protein
MQKALDEAFGQVAYVATLGLNTKENAFHGALALIYNVLLEQHREIEALTARLNETSLTHTENRPAYGRKQMFDLRLLVEKWPKSCGSRQWRQVISGQYPNWA